MKKLFKNFLLALVGVVFLMGTGKAYADTDDTIALKVLKGVELHAFAAASYSYNTNNPADRTNAFRVFDTDDNTFKFDAGELVLLKDAEKQGDAGFRIDLSFGFSQPDVNKSSPDPSITIPGQGTFSVNREDFDVQQGYVTYNAPIGNGLVIDAGKFITHIGAELMDGYDGFNYNISRSWGFSYGPFTHTGIRASYTINDKVSVLAMMSNSWDTTVDDNAGKVVGTQIALTPWKGISIYGNWVGGLEKSAGVTDGWRDLFDVVIDIELTDSTVLNMDILHGTMANGVVVGADANWWGFSGILHQGINKWLSANLRGEFFNDGDGFRSGLAQKLYSITFTPEARLTKNFVFRAEYRHDHSNVLAFGNRDGANRDNTQDTLSAQAIFFF